jgi:hypothetical protein
MSRVVVIALVSFGLAGCKRKPEPAAAASADGGVAATEKPGETKPKPPPMISRDAVTAVLERWLAAQNSGDFAAYSALYGDSFRGVRRSGDRTVRLDRAGWLADRERMFAKKMKVAASGIEISVGPGSAEIRMTQDWSSGSYRDVGPKRIRLERDKGELRLSLEEMLASVVVGASKDLPLSSPRFALVFGGKVILADEIEEGWGQGEPRLLRGDVPAPDPECETDPPDYEQDQTRWWACHAADPDNASDRFIASRDVAGDQLPKALAAWRGQELQLYDSRGPVCKGKVGEPMIWAEWETTATAVSASGDDLAANVLDKEPVLAAKLEGACGNVAFARAAALPPPPQWTLRPAQGALKELIRRELDNLFGQPELSDINGGPMIDVIELVPPKPGGRRLILGYKRGALGCYGDGHLTGVWTLGGTARDPELELVFEDSSSALELRAAADFTGDGIPEIVVADGLLSWQGEDYARYQPLDFPDEIEPSYCDL